MVQNEVADVPEGVDSGNIERSTDNSHVFNRAEQPVIRATIILLYNYLIGHTTEAMPDDAGISQRNQAINAAKGGT
jgi:hypothetical protein